ncbi:unnamed protein product [Blepharisma stoltei]|uniref:Uncharacterized protein n=1 Tax=Blepharisma stoltei TaxID=1481888 RepID=A0AAU9JKJ8_9CILI|nr:unnamed protein product [Blepharisma stoltei]
MNCLPHVSTGHIYCLSPKVLWCFLCGTFWISDAWFFTFSSLFGFGGFSGSSVMLNPPGTFSSITNTGWNLWVWSLAIFKIVWTLGAPTLLKRSTGSLILKSLSEVDVRRLSAIFWLGQDYELTDKPNSRRLRFN